MLAADEDDASADRVRSVARSPTVKLARPTAPTSTHGTGDSVARQQRPGETTSRIGIGKTRRMTSGSDAQDERRLQPADRGALLGRQSAEQQQRDDRPEGIEPLEPGRRRARAARWIGAGVGHPPHCSRRRGDAAIGPPANRLIRTAETRPVSIPFGGRFRPRADDARGRPRQPRVTGQQATEEASRATAHPAPGRHQAIRRPVAARPRRDRPRHRGRPHHRDHGSVRRRQVHAAQPVGGSTARRGARSRSPASGSTG